MACNTACILGIFSSGILYHSSSSCLIDDGGNLLLTLLSKTDQWFDDIVLAREDDEVHLHAPQNKTEHFWLCVWTIVFLKNCIVVRKQHMVTWMHLAT